MTVDQTNGPSGPLATDLDLRQGLPDSLRVLLADYPREQWEGHRNFDGLVRFWLDRHMMFRRIAETLKTDAVARKQGNLDPRAFTARLARLGSTFVGELHGHHNIEDVHYFPVLAAKDKRLASGFEILDRDHHALDAYLRSFVERANALLGPRGDQSSDVGYFIDELNRLKQFLDRHLIDEEELVVPVILKHGASDLG